MTAREQDMEQELQRETAKEIAQERAERLMDEERDEPREFRIPGVNLEEGGTEEETEEEGRDGFRTDAEADADVLRSAGWGSDEDYRMENDGDAFGEFGGE